MCLALANAPSPNQQPIVTSPVLSHVVSAETLIPKLLSLNPKALKPETPEPLNPKLVAEARPQRMEAARLPSRRHAGETAREWTGQRKPSSRVSITLAALGYKIPVYNPNQYNYS